MADLLEKGMMWLNQKREAYLTQAVEYIRQDAQPPFERTVLASFGQTDVQLTSDDGASIGSFAVDFLIDRNQLDFEPAPGDQIAYDNTVHEVMPLGDDYKGWRWTDPYHTTYRIHTREIGNQDE
ncbi:MAG: hypothetical protein MI744_06840 [Pseudomonadales bacterium]|nr:hypothetical protein [Pseudomonadales bacterium]